MTTSHRPANFRGLRPLAVEQLEPRQLLAGNVNAYVSNQTLVIWGDDAANGVTLTLNPSTKQYGVSGTATGGGPTTINGVDTTAGPVVFSGVKQVYVGLNGGDDEFRTGSPTAVDLAIAQWLSIEMGEGNDKAVLGNGGNVAGGADPVATRVRTGTSLNVNLGAGNDELDIGYAAVGLNLNVTAGDGDDKVRFGAEFTPAGATAPLTFPVNVKGGSTISLGGGADELKMANTTVLGSLSILDGAGAANITLQNLNVSKTISINTGDDADVIVVDTVRAKQLSINTNGGSDDVTIQRSAFTSLYVKLGGARDKLTLFNVRASLIASLDGGSGGSSFANSSSALHGLLRRNLG